MLDKRINVVFAMATAVLVGLAGCDGGNSSGAKSPPASVAAQLPAGLMLEQEPANAKAVAAVKRESNQGDDVVVRGRIGGRKEPFVSERAMFTIADTSMPPCGTDPGDKCPTPWDYCCEPPETILKNTLTIQVVGADGRPLKVGLKELSQLRPLAEITVRGRVSQKTGEQMMVVDATGIFIKKS